MNKLLINKKIILGIVLLCFLNLFCFVFSSSGRLKNTEYKDEIIEIIKNKDYSEAKNIIESAEKLIDGYEKDLASEGENELFNLYQEYERNNADFDKKNFKDILTGVLEQISYIEGYNSYVDGVIDNSDKLINFSIFKNNSEGNTANIIKTKLDFERIKDTKVSFENEDAFLALYDYKLGVYFCVAIMMLVLYTLIKERFNGVWMLNYTAPKGRGILSFRKNIYIMLMSLLVVVVNGLLILLTDIIVFNDAGWLFNPVQNNEVCKKITFSCSELNYYIYSIFLTFLIVMVIAMFFWLFMNIIRNLNHSIMFVGIVVVVEFFLYQKISSNSWLHILKDINIFGLLEINKILSSYRNIVIFGLLFSIQELIVIASFVIVAACFTGVVLCGNYIRPAKRITLIDRFFQKLQELYQIILAGMPEILKELHKTLITSKGWITVLVMLFFVFYFRDYNASGYADSLKEWDKIYETMGGKDYSQIEAKIEKARIELEQCQERIRVISDKYNNGEADMQDVVSSHGELLNYNSNYLYYKEFIQKQQYLNSLKEEKGIEGYMISDRPYEALFGKQAQVKELIMILILILGVSIIICQTFFIERNTNMISVLRCSKNGRERLFVRKVFSALILMTILFFVIYYLDISMVKNTYGFMYLDAPVQSLTFMSDYSKNIDIRTYIFITYFKKYIVGCLGLVVSFIMSKLMEKTNNQVFTLLLIMLNLIGVLILHKTGVI